eukprot:scaffold41896_cov69-Phaeocystis_antarctica.AAC.4
MEETARHVASAHRLCVVTEQRITWHVTALLKGYDTLNHVPRCVIDVIVGLVCSCVHTNERGHNEHVLGTVRVGHRHGQSEENHQAENLCVVALELSIEPKVLVEERAQLPLLLQGRPVLFAVADGRVVAGRTTAAASFRMDTKFTDDACERVNDPLGIEHDDLAQFWLVKPAKNAKSVKESQQRTHLNLKRQPLVGHATRSRELRHLTKGQLLEFGGCDNGAERVIGLQP